MGDRKHRFPVAIRTVDRFATPAALAAQSQGSGAPQLLVAPYISQEIAEGCRQLGQSFIDTAGNAYIEAPGVFIRVLGQTRPAGFREHSFRALSAAGLKLTFALLCQPKLLDANYRTIADTAGVALGTVSVDMKDMESRGFYNLRTKGKRRLLAPERMLEEWVSHYPITLRPKLILGRFRAEPERLQKLDLKKVGAYWSGEPAADRLTQYLKAAQFTIYAGQPIAKLVAAGRMQADVNGNVEILEKFWNSPAEALHEGALPEVVPPILVYADLLATHDSRNAEAAQMIYERHIATAFRD